MSEFFAALVAIFAAIPAIDRWLQAVFLEYRDLRFKQDEQLAAAALIKVNSEDSTEALQDVLGKN